jgi:hypothetical protein
LSPSHCKPRIYLKDRETIEDVGYTVLDTFP